MSKESIFNSVVSVKKPENYIVWHRNKAGIFKDETVAMNFVTIIREKEPHVYFDGWKQSFDGSNLVTVMSDDTYEPDLANEYLWKKFMAPQMIITSETI